MSHSVFEKFHKGVDSLLGIMLAAMVILVFTNVVLRYGFNSGIAVSDEMARYIFVWMIFIGAIVAVREHTHLGVDSVVRRLPPVGARVCAVLCDVLILIVMGLLIHGSWMQVVINLPTASPVSGISMAVLYIPGVIAGVSILMILSKRLWCLFQFKSAPDPRALCEGIVGPGQDNADKPFGG